jgi:hypothetical protein
MVALNPTKGIWEDWREVQGDIMQTYMSTAYPADHAIWNNMNNWIRL